jgi:phospholipase C
LQKARFRQSFSRIVSIVVPSFILPLLIVGCTTTSTTTKTPPTVTITASPMTVNTGGSSTLTVTATNATTVTVTGTGTSVTLAAAGGTTSVSPTATTTYTATATGSGGSITATVTVTVNTGPPPTVTITANPTSIVTGSSSTLTVVATNATTVTVAGSDGSSYTLAATGGTQSVSPTTTTASTTVTYTATATGPGGMITAQATVTVTLAPVLSVSITANPTTIFSGDTSTLTVTATNATAPVVVTGTDNSSYTLTNTGGTQIVSPTATTAATTVTYTATATWTGTPTTQTATATVTVNPGATAKQSVKNVIFMMQENHSFDNYFGMLNPYRKNPLGTGTCPDNAAGTAQCWNIGDDGNTYNVDGIDTSNTKANINNVSNPTDPGPPANAPGIPAPPVSSYSLFKFTSQCIDDESSGWLASFGDVNRYDFDSGRAIQMTGFVHNANGYAGSCRASGAQCSGNFTDDYYGQRSMGYYDQGTLNYYYYMASQFALSDRWFSPVASKTIDNRIATFTGGTTQGLVQDPGGDDHLTGNLAINTILQNLTVAGVSWKLYYTVNLGFCFASADDDCTSTTPNKYYPATDFNNLSDATNYLRLNPSGSTSYCATLVPPLQPSSNVGDASNSFCIDTNHIAPLSQYYTDLTAGTLPSFAFIEPGYANDDEHPGSGQPVGAGQGEVAKVVNALMATAGTANNYWANSIFFFAYDEGGGPYDHVPPVPGHSNDLTTSANLGYITGGLSAPPDISGISVNPDPSPNANPATPPPNDFFPCVPPNPPGTATDHCDLEAGWPGAPASGSDVVTENGFGAQLGFRVPNIVISPFSRRHYVSHIPMDHTAIIRFVEDLFIGNQKYLTLRDAVQPNLLDFFDFNNIPWATPPTPPSPVSPGNCTPGNFAP